jgi:hypothetical protein
MAHDGEAGRGRSRPRGHDVADHHSVGRGGHHAHMVADFRRRFWVSLVVSMPVLALSPLIQGWLGLGQKLAFPGDRWVQAVLATVVYLYGGRPFVRGVADELRRRQPGMITLIALAPRLWPSRPRSKASRARSRGRTLSTIGRTTPASNQASDLDQLATARLHDERDAADPVGGGLPPRSRAIVAGPSRQPVFRSRPSTLQG